MPSKARQRYQRFNKRLEPNQKSLLVRAIHRTQWDVIKNIFQPNISAIERFSLVVFLGFSLWHSTVLITSSINKFTNEPILYVFYGSIPLESVPFPSVTVCPLHLFRLSTKLEAMRMLQQSFEMGYAKSKNPNVMWDLDEILKLVHMMDHVCGLGSSFTKTFNASLPKSAATLKLEDILANSNLTLLDYPEDEVYKKKILPFIKKGLIDCSKILGVCFCERDPKKCVKVLVPVISDMGKCCSFNRIPDEDLRKHKGLLWYLSMQGFEVDLTEEVKAWKEFIIDKHPFLRRKQNTDITLSYDEQIELGMKNALKLTIPRIQKVAGQQNGFSFLLINNVFENDTTCPVHDGVGFKIQVHSPLEEPEVLEKGILIDLNHEVLLDVRTFVTIPNESLEHVDQVVRECIFQKEHRLEYYTRYTEGNCRKDCLTRLTFEKCHCFKLSMSTGRNETVCGYAEANCTKEILYNLTTLGYDLMCSKYPPCYPACTEITYETKMSSVIHSKSELFKLVGQNYSSTQDMNIVHVFMGSEITTARGRHPKYDIEDKISILGGILGLTSGLDYGGILHLIFGIFYGMFGFLKWLVGLECKEDNIFCKRTKKRSSRQTRKANRQRLNRAVPPPRRITRVKPATRVFLLQNRQGINRQNDGIPTEHHL